VRAILVMARGKLDRSASTRSWASTTSILDLVGASQVVRCARCQRGPVRPIARSVEPGYGRLDEPPNWQRHQKRICFVRPDNEESIGFAPIECGFCQERVPRPSAGAVKFSSWWIGSGLVRATSVAVGMRVIGEKPRKNTHFLSPLRNQYGYGLVQT
jgi:hypothetical protein